MTITINRLTVNNLYSMGQLLASGIPVSHTIESTADMLPTGRYDIHIRKRSARKQDILVTDTEGKSVCSIRIGHSWKSGQKYAHDHRQPFSSVIIGKPITPGAMFKSMHDYMHIIDLITYHNNINDPVCLVVTSKDAISTRPTELWTR